MWVLDMAIVFFGHEGSRHWAREDRQAGRLGGPHQGCRGRWPRRDDDTDPKHYPGMALKEFTLMLQFFIRGLAARSEPG
jgi:hypothetical protein